ncbi:hypothetical protein BH23ACT2_BH23ACT2_08000 [soil metagenome]
MGTEREGEKPTIRWTWLRPGRLLALLGLTGFALSQPLLSVAGENPTLFTFADVGGLDLVVFAVVVALVPPLVLWLLVVGAGLIDRRAGDVAFRVVAAVLAGLTAIQLAQSFGAQGPVVLVAIAVLFAVGFVVALVRWRWVDQWVRYTSPLPVVALLAFLLATPSGQLLRSPAAAERIDVAGVAPVVFVMLDEFPAGSLLGPDGGIDPARFPNFAAFAEDATWYRNYTIMAPSTVKSVPTMLTGRRPSDDQPLWTDHPDSLFSLLAPSHDLAVFETVTQLCGFENCTPDATEDGDGTSSGGRVDRLGGVLGDITDAWVDRVSPHDTGGADLGQFQEDAIPLAGEPVQPGANEDFGNPDEVRARPGRVTDFLDALEPGSRPGLRYLHLMLPHQPWMFYPDGQQYSLPDAGEDFDLPDPDVPEGEPVPDTDPSGDSAPDVEPLDPDWGLAIIEQQHLLQASYTDRLVGEVLGRVRETGLYDDAVVVVTSDHGVTFDRWPNQRNADDESVGDIGFVPLLVKGPGQTEPPIDDSNLMAVDLLPTLAEAIGVEVPWEVDGHPAGSPEIAARGDAKEMVALTEGFRGAISGMIEFDSARRPLVEDRLIGPITEDAPSLGGLVDRIGAAELLGTPVDDLEPTPGGSAAVVSIDDLRTPRPDAPVIGGIQGVVDVPADQGTILVAIDGSIVTAAPLEPNGLFDTLLPPGALDPAGNDVRLVVLADDEVFEPEVR